MVSNEQLDQYRVEGIRVRVIRDANARNDVKGLVVAWNADSVLIRKGNRKVLKVSRNYQFQPLSEERQAPEFLENTFDLH